MSHLCRPSAYSLIMRQLGRNSGLTTCRASRQSSDNPPVRITSCASIALFAAPMSDPPLVEQSFQLIEAGRNAFGEAHLDDLTQGILGRVDQSELHAVPLAVGVKVIFPSETGRSVFTLPFSSQKASSMAKLRWRSIVM